MFSQLTRYASELDIPIEDAEMDIRTRYDLRGKVLVADVTPAAQAVEYVWEIKSPASPEQIQKLARMIEEGCHTVATIRNPTPLFGRIIHNGVELNVYDYAP